MNLFDQLKSVSSDDLDMMFQALSSKSLLEQQKLMHLWLFTFVSQDQARAVQVVDAVGQYLNKNINGQPTIMQLLGFLAANSLFMNPSVTPKIINWIVDGILPEIMLKIILQTAVRSKRVSEDLLIQALPQMPYATQNALMNYAVRYSCTKIIDFVFNDERFKLSNTQRHKLLISTSDQVLLQKLQVMVYENLDWRRLALHRSQLLQQFFESELQKAEIFARFSIWTNIEKFMNYTPDRLSCEWALRLFFKFPPVTLLPGKNVLNSTTMKDDDERLTLMREDLATRWCTRIKSKAFWNELFDKEPGLLFRNVMLEILNCLSHLNPRDVKNLVDHVCRQTFANITDLAMQSSLNYEHSHHAEPQNKLRYPTDVLTRIQNFDLSIEQSIQVQQQNVRHLEGNLSRLLVLLQTDPNGTLIYQSVSSMSLVESVLVKHYLSEFQYIFEHGISKIKRKLEFIVGSWDVNSFSQPASLLKGYEHMMNLWHKAMERLLHLNLHPKIQAQYRYLEKTLIPLFTMPLSILDNIKNVIEFQFGLDIRPFHDFLQEMPPSVIKTFAERVRDLVIHPMNALFPSYVGTFENAYHAWELKVERKSLSSLDNAAIETFDAAVMSIKTAMPYLDLNLYWPFVDRASHFWTQNYGDLQVNLPGIKGLVSCCLVQLALKKDKRTITLVDRIALLHVREHTPVIPSKMSDWSDNQFLEILTLLFNVVNMLQDPVNVKDLFGQSWIDRMVRILAEGGASTKRNNAEGKKASRLLSQLNQTSATRLMLRDLLDQALATLQTQRSEAFKMFFDDTWKTTPESSEVSVFEQLMLPHIPPHDKRKQRFIDRRFVVIRDMQQRLEWLNGCVSDALKYAVETRHHRQEDKLVEVLDWVHNKISRVEWSRLNMTHPTISHLRHLLDIYMPRLHPFCQRQVDESPESNAKFLEHLTQVLDDMWKAEQATFGQQANAMTEHCTRVVKSICNLRLIQDCNLIIGHAAVEERIQSYNLWLDWLVQVRHLAVVRRQSEQYAEENFVMPVINQATVNAVLDTIAKTNKHRQRLQPVWRRILRDLVEKWLKYYKQYISPDQYKIMEGDVPSDVDKMTERIQFNTIQRILQIRVLVMGFAIIHPCLLHAFQSVHKILVSDYLRTKNVYQDSIKFIREMNMTDYLSNQIKTHMNYNVHHHATPKEIYTTKDEIEVLDAILDSYKQSMHFLLEQKLVLGPLYAPLSQSIERLELMKLVGKKRLDQKKTLRSKTFQIYKTLTKVCPSFLRLHAACQFMFSMDPHFVLDTVRENNYPESKLLSGKGSFGDDVANATFLVPTSTKMLKTEIQLEIGELYRKILEDPRENLIRRTKAVKNYADLDTSTVVRLYDLWKAANAQKDPPHPDIKKGIAMGLLNRVDEISESVPVIFSPDLINDRDVNVFLIDGLTRLSKIGGRKFFELVQDNVLKKFKTLGVASMNGILRLLCSQANGTKMLLELWSKRNEYRKDVQENLMRALVSQLNNDPSEELWSTLEETASHGGSVCFDFAFVSPPTNQTDRQRYLQSLSPPIPRAPFPPTPYFFQLDNIEVSKTYFARIFKQLVNKREDLDQQRLNHLAIQRITAFAKITAEMDDDIYDVLDKELTKLQLEVDLDAPNAFKNEAPRVIVGNLKFLSEIEIYLREHGQLCVEARCHLQNVFGKHIVEFFKLGTTLETDAGVYTNMKKLNEILPHASDWISQLGILDASVAFRKRTTYEAVFGAYDNLVKKLK